MCAACSPGHQNVKGRCIPCVQYDYLRLSLTGAAYVVGGIAIRCVISQSLTRSNMIGTMSFFGQTLALLSLRNLAITYVSDIFSFSFVNAGACIVPLAYIERWYMEMFMPPALICAGALLGHAAHAAASPRKEQDSPIQHAPMLRRSFLEIYMFIYGPCTLKPLNALTCMAVEQLSGGVLAKRHVLRAHVIPP